MPSAAKRAVAPSFLLACLVLGGSAQGFWQNALLQLAGIMIITWAVGSRVTEPLPNHSRQLLYLAIAGLAVIALQQVPLPATLWAFGVRGRIAADYSIIKHAPPWLPISLTPYESLATMLCLIPPLATYLTIVRLKAYRKSWLACALLAGTVGGIILGAVQVADANQNSPWYPFSETNIGSAVGFFANANHMATLLLIGLPFVAALGAEARGRGAQRSLAVLVVAAAIALLLVVGIILNGSFAGFVLVVPVIAASGFIIAGPNRIYPRIAAALVVIAMIAAIVGITSGNLGTSKIARDAATAVQSREIILKTTSMAIGDFMPFGSGLGSFLRVYRLYEDPAAVTNEYVIHAHDDYAELVLELGIPGALLILLFLVWWIQSVLDVWRNGSGGPYARAATIASAAILIHSLVDFPLRTSAISACFAMCLALLSDRRKPVLLTAKDLRPVRHLVFE